MTAVLAFLLGPIGRYLLIAGVAVVIIGGTYAKGRFDGKEAYQAKLTREIDKAVSKGDESRVDALKKFDTNKEIEDDGFARD